MKYKEDLDKTVCIYLELNSMHDEKYSNIA